MLRITLAPFVILLLSACAQQTASGIATTDEIVADHDLGPILYTYYEPGDSLQVSYGYGASVYDAVDGNRIAHLDKGSIVQVIEVLEKRDRIRDPHEPLQGRWIMVQQNSLIGYSFGGHYMRVGPQ